VYTYTCIYIYIHVYWECLPATSALAGCAMTSSNTPKGITAERGVWIHSGNVRLECTMFADFAPNVLGVASGSMADSGSAYIEKGAGAGRSILRSPIAFSTWSIPASSSLPPNSAEISSTVTWLPESAQCTYTHTQISMSHAKKTWHIWISHGTYEWVMARMITGCNWQRAAKEMSLKL